MLSSVVLTVTQKGRNREKTCRNGLTAEKPKTSDRADNMPALPTVVIRHRGASLTVRQSALAGSMLEEQLARAAEWTAGGGAPAVA